MLLYRMSNGSRSSFDLTSSNRTTSNLIVRCSPWHWQIDHTALLLLRLDHRIPQPSDPYVSSAKQSLLQSISSSVAQVPNRSRLRSTRSTLSNLRHRLVVIARNRRRDFIKVPNTAPPKRALTTRIIRRWCPNIPSVLLNRSFDIAEDISFEQSVGGFTFEGVPDVVGPQVVD